MMEVPPSSKVSRNKIACRSIQEAASMIVAKRSLFSHSVSPSTKDSFEIYPSMTSSHTCDARMTLMTMMKWKMQLNCGHGLDRKGGRNKGGGRGRGILSYRTEARHEVKVGPCQVGHGLLGQRLLHGEVEGSQGEQ